VSTSRLLQRRAPHYPFPTRRSSDLRTLRAEGLGRDLVGQKPGIELEALRRPRDAGRMRDGAGRLERRSKRVTRHRDQHDVRGAEDRKSTRLNSSHVKNSYAVVCLKK